MLSRHGLFSILLLLIRNFILKLFYFVTRWQNVIVRSYLNFIIHNFSQFFTDPERVLVTSRPHAAAHLTGQQNWEVLWGNTLAGVFFFFTLEKCKHLFFIPPRSPTPRYFLKENENLCAHKNFRVNC